MNYYERLSTLIDRISDDPFLLDTLLRQIPLFSEYIKAVVNYKVGCEIAEKMYTGSEKTEFIHKLDLNRHNAHEAVIASCKLIDRISSQYGFRVFDGVNLNNRHEVAVAVGELVNLMYRLELANGMRG